jgi:hypothetical protein
MTRVRAAVATAVALMSASAAFAGGTQLWEVRTAENFSEGKLEGVVVGARGLVFAGWSASRREVEADAVWCLLPDGQGGAYVGTGTKGEVLQIVGNKTEKLAETKQTAVTVMRRYPGGVLVGTMPEGRIFLLNQGGDLSEFIALEAKYIWDMAVTPDGTVFAATGPDGKLFRIVDGKAELWFKSKEPNLLSIASTPGGALYVGSGEKGLLYRVTGKDTATVVYDFDENEVRAILLRDDHLLIAANAAKTKGGTSKPAADGDAPKAPEGKEESAPPSKEPMDCAVYHLSSDGNIEALFASKGEFIWSMAALADGTFLVATGEKGRVYRGHEPENRGAPVVEGEAADVLFDLDEGQALAMGVEFGELLFIGTGNGGAIYDVSSKMPGRGIYTSKVLDAKHVSTWGQAEWDAQGPVTLETRSGATSEPDDTWNAWTPVDKADGRITNPRSRYLQFRADVSARGSALRAVRIAYLPDNQRPAVASIELAIDDKAKPKNGKETSASPPLPTHTSSLTIKWSAKDPDGDAVVCRLLYRLEEELDEHLRSMNSGEPLVGDKYTWETRGLPDGRYVVRVVVSDERDNPPERVRSVARDSDPILVDHTPPAIIDLSVNRREVTGEVRDKASRISHLSWVLDGADAQLLACDDGLLDGRREAFRFSLPKDITRGRHALAIQCADEAGNLSVERLAFTVE